MPLRSHPISRFLSTTIRLSLVGISSASVAAWILAHDVDGRALAWITLLSVLGAGIALPTSILAMRRLAEQGPPRRA